MGCVLPCGKNCAHNTVIVPKVRSGTSRACTDMRNKHSSTSVITENAMRLAALKKLKDRPWSVSRIGNKCKPWAVSPNNVALATRVVLSAVRCTKQPTMYAQVAK